MEQEYKMNSENNETKIIVAEINSQAEADRLAMMNQDDGIQEPEVSEESRANLLEKMREFDERLKLDRERLSFDKEKAQTDAKLKEKQINKKPSTSK